MKKSKKARTREIEAAAGLALRIEEKRTQPKKATLRRKYQQALWRREKAIEDALREEGFEPPKRDAYHANIAQRGTTISPAQGDDR